MTKKIGGFVIDGAIRDLVEWADGQVPVFAKGHTHRGPSKEGPGRINAPIACAGLRSEEHTPELQSLMRISYAVFCLKKKKKNKQMTTYKILLDIKQT